jgi:CheY-like chemotaxis protein
MEANPDRPLILVVDDNESVRDVVCGQLEADSFATVQAADGETALHLLKGHEPIIAIVDMLMPPHGGSTLILKLKRLRPALRILAMSGGGPKYLALATELGADEVISKPFRSAELVSKVRRLVG